MEQKVKEILSKMEEIYFSGEWGKYNFSMKKEVIYSSEGGTQVIKNRLIIPFQELICSDIDYQIVFEGEKGDGILIITLIEKKVISKVEREIATEMFNEIKEYQYSFFQNKIISQRFFNLVLDLYYLTFSE